MFLFIKQKAEFTLGHTHDTVISLMNNHKSVTISRTETKLRVVNVLMFLNFCNKGA